MNIVVLSSRFPYPLERGDKLRLYHQIRILSEQHKIHLFSISTEDVSNTDLKELRKYCASISVVRISKLEIGVNLLRTAFTTLPFQSGQYYNKRIKSLLQDFLKNKKLDVVYCQLVRMAPLALDVKLPVVVDFMDAFSIGMKKRASLSTFPMKQLFGLESKKLKYYEKYVSEKADALTIISKQDSYSISKSNKEIEIIANGIDFKYFEPKVTIKDYDVCFIGNLGYIPNIEASKYLCSKIKVQYKKLYDVDLKVLLAGARPHQSLFRFKKDGVALMGWTEDIRKSYLSAKIMVAPLFEGTGQQNKILEAMALGIPCVTSTKVNNAIFATDGESIMLADTVDQFCEKINLLLNEPKAYKLVKTKGRTFVEQNFSWKHHTEKLNHIFAQIIGN